MPDDRPLPCGLRLALGHLSGGSVVLADVARMLSRYADRVVIDQTGLSGRFDIILNYSPDHLEVSPSTSAPGVSDRPSLFTAVQEQIRVRVVALDAAVQGVLIHHIQPPPGKRGKPGRG